MDEALELRLYLPASFRSPGEQEYIYFLWDAFEANYRNGLYHFAYLAYHMLMMSFVYFSIWQIRQTLRDDFNMGVIGFGGQENTLLNANSPFTFSEVNERSILRLFRLISCDSAMIGQYAKLVDLRNNAAHPNGNILFKMQPEIDKQTGEVLRAVDEIQTRLRPVIESCYREFLIRSTAPSEREYPADDDQIREVLIHNNYMSPKDIEFCAAFSVETLARPELDAMKSLHQSLIELQ